MDFVLGNTVNFSAFDWQSFSTLATGFLAVGAAWLVGKKQITISNEQKAILERQVDLEESKLRSDLFKQRFETSELAADLLINITEAIHESKSIERERLFLLRMRESMFLFSDDNVYKFLKDIKKLRDKVRENLILQAQTTSDRTQIQRLQGEILEHKSRSLEMLDELPTVFGKDLSILSVKTDNES